MNPTILYSVLEIIGIVLFSSEGLFVKNIELHPLINVLLAYMVYAVVSFIILSVREQMSMTFIKQLVEPKFLITNFANIIKTGGLFLGFKLLPVSFAIVIKMMAPAFIIIGNSLLNSDPMNGSQILGITLSVLLIGLIYKNPISVAFKNINPSFFLGTMGVILYNIMNAYNVIKLPQYITDKNPHEEIFISTAVAFTTMLTIVTGIFFTNRKLLGSFNHYNIIKMIGVFISTCYIGMSLTYAADNHLEPILFSMLQYSQIFIAFGIGYFLEGEKFPLSRIILIILFLLSIVFTMRVSKKPVKKDKRKIITNATLFHSEYKKTNVG